MTPQEMSQVEPEQLDALLEECMQAVSEYNQLQYSICEALRRGHVKLSETRYSLGAQRVSQLQYPCAMTATFTMSIDGESTDKVISSDGLRNRHVTTDDANVNDSDEKKSKQKAPPNPIKWFSALPPPSLREAQRSFVTVAELASELARSKERLRHLLDQYEDAKAKM